LLDTRLQETPEEGAYVSDIKYIFHLILNKADLPKTPKPCPLIEALALVSFCGKPISIVRHASSFKLLYLRLLACQISIQNL
jgi:hypothetical protein